MKNYMIIPGLHQKAIKNKKTMAIANICRLITEYTNIPKEIFLKSKSQKYEIITAKAMYINMVLCFVDSKQRPLVEELRLDHSTIVHHKKKLNNEREKLLKKLKDEYTARYEA